MYVENEDLNRIVIRSSKDVAFHYQVNGVRKAFKDMPPIRDDIEGFFVPESAKDDMARIYPEEARRRLIANGTFNPDGTLGGGTL